MLPLAYRVADLLAGSSCGNVRISCWSGWVAPMRRQPWLLRFPVCLHSRCSASYGLHRWVLPYLRATVWTSKMTLYALNMLPSSLVRLSKPGLCLIMFWERVCSSFFSFRLLAFWYRFDSSIHLEKPAFYQLYCLMVPERVQANEVLFLILSLKFNFMILKTLPVIDEPFFVIQIVFLQFSIYCICFF